jgi:hypothetical protein
MQISSIPTGAKPLDHLVLPVADLAVARGRLTALGFNVSPDGVHPFGTANCCVYLADGTFLEPLAVADQEAAEAAAGSGNVFVERDAAFRRRVGEDGFSALVVGTNDAEADHARFAAHGFSAGNMLEFSRPFVDAAGRRDTATFRLAFAADRHAPDVFFFSCQRLNTPVVDRTALQRHGNGATRTCKVLLSAEQPLVHAGVLAEITGRTRPVGGHDQIELAATNAAIVVLTPTGLRRDFGIDAASNRSLRLAGLVLGVADLSLTENLLRTNAIAFEQRNRSLIVRPAPGQGTTFIFEES